MIRLIKAYDYRQALLSEPFSVNPRMEEAHDTFRAVLAYLRNLSGLHSDNHQTFEVTGDEEVLMLIRLHLGEEPPADLAAHIRSGQPYAIRFSDGRVSFGKKADFLG